MQLDEMDGKAKKKTGKEGEDEACRFLIDKGHTILERNWRSGHLEIDIISMDMDGIHFVEVKTRRPPMQGNPEESVTAGKQRRIAAAAARYLATRQGRAIGDMECMFDIISIIITGNGDKTVRYYPAAYYPVFV